jgi:Sec7-like guanine-nucleotide exchange factor
LKEQNKTTTNIANENAAYLLVTQMMMLNTEQSNPNIPKKMEFQKDNLNLEMIVKLRRIERIMRIASKKSQI